MAYRRQAVFSLLVKGTTNQYEIAEKLHISQATAFRDIQFLKDKAVEQMGFHIHERLPWEYKICSEGITQVLRYAWSLLHDNNKNVRVNRVGVLSLIAQLCRDRLEMATNSLVISDSLNQLDSMRQQILGLNDDNSNLSTPIIAHIK